VLRPSGIANKFERLFSGTLGIRLRRSFELASVFSIPVPGDFDQGGEFVRLAA
jgi:hypothetical protein